MNLHCYGPFQVGDRVQAHPATDTWMRGDRFGQIEKITKGRRRGSEPRMPIAYVRMDVSRRLIRFSLDNLLTI